MDHTKIFPAGNSPALGYAAHFLSQWGVCVGEKAATHILLDVPTKVLPVGDPGITVIGGNLDMLPPEIPRMDLLQDAEYVAENAALTADCALRVLTEQLPCAIRGCTVLIIGWGRIGKCLASLLKSLDARVTVAARKPADRAMARALGYGAIPTENMDTEPFRVIFNTVPAPVLEPGEGIRIDLASQRGMAGENVIHARGLPGKMLPESSGKLIACTILRHLKGEKV